MVYTFESIIRYSETDSTGHLTLQGLIDYFQDTSIMHSESLMQGVTELDQANKAWILTNWRIILSRMPKLGERVKVHTWAYEMKGFYGLRNFALEDAGGERIAFADTTWVYMDTEKGRPVRIPKELAEIYDPETPIPLKKCPRKMELPQEWTDEASIVVPTYFIDTNHHMNNSHYVQVASAFLPKDFVSREIRVEYRKSAMLGDTICPRVTCEDDKVTVNLADPEGKTYAGVEFFRA